MKIKKVKPVKEPENFIVICIHKNLGTAEAGTEVRVNADENGIPLNAFWRKRLRDSNIDGCCSLKANTPEKTKKTSKGDK